MKRELENILEDCKVGYEMYPLFTKLKKGRQNISIDYSRIDNVPILIKLRNFYKKFNFEEELEEIQNDLDKKLVEYKKYVKYCRSFKPEPLESKYYSHITDSINKMKSLFVGGPETGPSTK